MMIWRSLQPNALGRLLEIAVDAYRNRKAVRTAGHFDDDEPGRPTTGSDRRPAKGKDAARTVTGASYHPMAMREVCPGWLRTIVVYQKG